MGLFHYDVCRLYFFQTALAYGVCRSAHKLSTTTVKRLNKFYTRIMVKVIIKKQKI